MSKAVKILHLIAVCVFVGSIPGHIVLGALGDPNANLTAFADYQIAKHVLTETLTVAGLAVTVISGIALAALWRQQIRRRWLQIKAGLAVLITANAAFVLVPLSGDMAALAQAALSGGTLDPLFHDLAARESMFGAANLIMILGVIALAVFRPGGQARADLGTAQTVS